jgi:hypothetical protein
MVSTPLLLETRSVGATQQFLCNSPRLHFHRESHRLRGTRPAKMCWICNALSHIHQPNEASDRATLRIDSFPMTANHPRSEMQGADLATLYVGPDHAASIYRNCLLMIAKADPLPQTTQHLPRWLSRLKRENAGATGFMVVLRADMPLPRDEVRETIKQLFRIFSDVVTFGAFVVEKEGFAAAAQRSILNMIMLAARPPFTMKVFATVEEASTWVATKHGAKTRLVAPELIDVIDRLTAAYVADTLTVNG